MATWRKQQGRLRFVTQHLQQRGHKGRPDEGLVVKASRDEEAKVFTVREGQDALDTHDAMAGV